MYDQVEYNESTPLPPVDSEMLKRLTPVASVSSMSMSVQAHRHLVNQFFVVVVCLFILFTC